MSRCPAKYAATAIILIAPPAAVVTICACICQVKAKLLVQDMRRYSIKSFDAASLTGAC